jgi:hypothetical protein
LFLTKKERKPVIFSSRKIHFAAIACTALCGYAATIQAAEPDIAFAASGVFAIPAIGGADAFGLAGEPFTLSFTINEAAKPTRHSETISEYDKVPVVVEAISRNFGPQPQIRATATLVLAAGTSGKPDRFFLTFPIVVEGGLTVRFTARIRMPAGTIASPAIQPFTASVPLAYSMPYLELSKSESQ